MDVSAERVIDAPPKTVYACIADVRQHYPHFLPPAFSDFQVVEGGVGAGSMVQFTLTAGGRSRRYRMVMAEPEPGRVITESDTGSSLVTTFTVTGVEKGTRVRIASVWEGAGGVGGFFERLFAPRTLRRIYIDELARARGVEGGVAG
jgi:uncharacterized protein YndB with AHSA1/START domain